MINLCQWLSTAAREKNEKSHMKVYSKATSYSFQGPNHNSSGSDDETFGFCINDFLGPSQNAVCNLLLCRILTS